MQPCTASLTRRELLASGTTLPFLQNMSTKPAAGVSATARDTHVKLNSGNKMPLLGLGTSQAQGDECETAVKKAIDLGYRVSHLLCCCGPSLFCRSPMKTTAYELWVLTFYLL